MARRWSRETVLLASLAALVGMFGITQIVVGFYTTRRSHLARSWYNQGDHALENDQAEQAIADLRNALSYSPDDTDYQLRLAQALAAAGRIEEAENYLRDLWTREPGDGQVNLELAELEARQGDQTAAVQYYNNAIAGAWYQIGGVSPLERRWQARLDLLQYWFSQHNLPQAQAVLLALAANVAPGDYQRRTTVAQFQMQANAPRAALSEFQQALQEDEEYAPALAGAGAAEIAIGQYEDAIPYLDRAARLDPKNQQVADQLKLARLVSTSDPFEIGLGEAQRARRTKDAFNQAQAALTACAAKRGFALPAPSAPENALQQAWDRGLQLQPLLRQLGRNSQTDLTVMNFVYSSEDLVASTCGPLQGKDQALWLIGKMHRLTTQASSSQGAK